MTYTTVRKNSVKRIEAYLREAEYIEFKTSSMQMDDSYDCSMIEYTPEQAIEFYRNSGDIDKAYIYDEGLEGEYLYIGGQYHFQDSVEAYKKIPAAKLEYQAKIAKQAEEFTAKREQAKKLAGIERVQIKYSENRTINRFIKNVPESQEFYECDYYQAEGILFAGLLEMRTVRGEGLGGYDKTGINLIFQDGEEYSYRLDLNNSEPSIAQGLLQRIEHARQKRDEPMPDAYEDIKQFWLAFPTKYQFEFNPEYVKPVEPLDCADYGALIGLQASNVIPIH